MSRDEFNKQVESTRKFYLGFLEDRCRSLAYSGAVDYSDVGPEDFHLAQAVICAALLDIGALAKPKPNNSRGRTALKNLRNF